MTNIVVHDEVDAAANPRAHSAIRGDAKLEILLARLAISDLTFKSCESQRRSQLPGWSGLEIYTPHTYIVFAKCLITALLIAGR